MALRSADRATHDFDTRWRGAGADEDPAARQLLDHTDYYSSQKWEFKQALKLLSAVKAGKVVENWLWDRWFLTTSGQVLQSPLQGARKSRLAPHLL